jgi:hypothetical protein
MNCSISFNAVSMKLRKILINGGPGRTRIFDLYRVKVAGALQAMAGKYAAMKTSHLDC